VSLALTPLVVGVIVAVVLVAGAVNGVAGFGFALVGTMALASLVDPATAVVFMILPIFAVNLSLVRELSVPQLRTCGRRFAPLLGAALVGTVVGLAALDVVPAGPLRVGLGLLSLAFVVTAQEDFARIPYGPLSPVSVTGRERNPSIQVGDDPLVRGIRFPPPNAYLAGETRNGSQTVVRAGDSPLIARGSLGEGQTFYYGYIAADSTFQFNYQYPVFWKRLIYEAAGRETLTETNLPAGGTLSVANGTTVQRPGGETEVAAGGSVRLDRTGFYRVGDRRYGVSLLSVGESNVSAPSLQVGEDSIVKPREEVVQRPLDLSPLVAVGAVVAVFGELALLRRRGDL